MAKKTYNITPKITTIKEAKRKKDNTKYDAFIDKRVPKKYGEFSSWWDCIDHYMKLYGCTWSWYEEKIELTSPKDTYTIDIKLHYENGMWDVTKAGELLISLIKDKKVKKLTKKELTRVYGSSI